MSFPDIRRRSRKWLSVEEIRFLIVLLIFILAMLALNMYLARTLPGGEWLYMRWSGARAFLIEKIEPYGTEISQRVQDTVYGRIATESEYPFVLNDPFHIVLLYVPLALFSDFTLARAIWMLLSEAALVGIVLQAIDLSEWQPPRWLYILLIGLGLFSYFSLQALISGSTTIFLTFLYLAIILALRAYSDELAGAFLFLVAYQWEVGALFFPYILVLVFANRRWGVLTGFGMSLVVALVISFLTYPGWGLPYIRAVLSDWYRGANINLNSIAAAWFPDSRFSVGVITSIVVGVIIFIEMVSSTQSHFRRIVWTVCLSLAATPLLGFAIFPSNHVVLIPALILILTLMWERWTRRRALAVLLVLSVAFLIPFGIYFRGTMLSDRLYSDLLSALPPIATILGLYWMRWWVLHSPRSFHSDHPTRRAGSPRTWSDQTGLHR